eukprot:7391575-Prymnesium_polylepis.1
MAERYARMAGRVSASSPEKLTLKRNTCIDDCQAGAISGRRSASPLLGWPNVLGCEDAVHGILNSGAALA